MYQLTEYIKSCTTLALEYLPCGFYSQCNQEGVEAKSVVKPSGTVISSQIKGLVNIYILGFLVSLMCMTFSLECHIYLPTKTEPPLETVTDRSLNSDSTNGGKLSLSVVTY